MSQSKIRENIMEATTALRDIDNKQNDALTSDKIRKINSFIDAQQDLLHRLEKLEINLQRPPLSESYTSTRGYDDVYDMAFGKYLRRGIEPYHADTLRSLGDDEHDDSGYKITKRMADEIQYGISNRSTIRKVAEIINVSRDSYDRVNLPDDILASWSMNEVEQNAHAQLTKSQIQVHELYAQPKSTQQMLEDASIDIESWLARELIETFCDAEEKAFINGDGVGKPQGILSRINDIKCYDTEQSNSISADDIINLYYNINSRYSTNGKFIIGRDCAQAIRTMKDKNGRYIWQPSLQEDGTETLLGCEVLTSAHMPKIKNGQTFTANETAVLFGDFSKAYQIIDRQDIRVLRDPFTQKPYVKFYSTKRVGGMLNKLDAICALKISA